MRGGPTNKPTRQVDETSTTLGNADYTFCSVSLSLPSLSLWGDPLTGTREYDVMDRTHTYGEGLDRYGMLGDLLRYGSVVLKGCPADIGLYEEFLGSIGVLRNTNWGTYFKVVAQPDRSSDGSSDTDVAYSALAIPLHTDGPYNENPLAFQLLHAVKQSAVGGESLLSDGHAAADALRRSNPAAFNVLATEKVSFRYHDETNDLFARRTMINVNDDGSLGSIFFSGRLDISPHKNRSVQQVEEFYAAKKAFLELLYHPSCRRDFKLDDGDVLIFDNRRVLHGRSAFSDSVAPAGDAGADAGAAGGGVGEESGTFLDDGDDGFLDFLEENGGSETAAVDANGKRAHKEPLPLGGIVDGIELATVSRYLRGCYLDSVDMKYRALHRKSQIHAVNSAMREHTAALGQTPHADKQSKKETKGKGKAAKSMAQPQQRGMGLLAGSASAHAHAHTHTHTRRAVPRGLGPRAPGPGERGMATMTRREQPPSPLNEQYTSLATATADDIAIMNELYSEASTGKKLASRAVAMMKILNQANIVEDVGIPDAHLCPLAPQQWTAGRPSCIVRTATAGLATRRRPAGPRQHTSSPRPRR